ncbi:MAG: cache domain-containing protein [Rhodospirillaceae bacterium]
MTDALMHRLELVPRWAWSLGGGLLVAALVVGFAYGQRLAEVNDGHLRAATLFHETRKATLEDYIASAAFNIIAVSQKPDLAEELLYLTYATRAGAEQGGIERIREVSRARQRLRGWMAKVVELFDFRDAMLISAEGTVVYATVEETIQGRDLMGTLHRDSALSEAYQRAVRYQSRIVVADLPETFPTDGSLFIVAALAIRDQDGKLSGVMAVKLDVRKVAKMLQADAADTGLIDAYLLDRDGRLLTRSRPWLSEPPLGVYLETPAAQQANMWFTGEMQDTEGLFGEQVQVVYGPVRSGTLQLSLMTEGPLVETLSPDQLIWELYFAALAGFFTFGLLHAFMPRTSDSDRSRRAQFRAALRGEDSADYQI